MVKDLTDNKSKLVQLMAWCRQVTVTRTNFDSDLCCHLASLGNNELSYNAKWFYSNVKSIGITCLWKQNLMTWKMHNTFTSSNNDSNTVKSYDIDSIVQDCHNSRALGALCYATDVI